MSDHSTTSASSPTPPPTALPTRTRKPERRQMLLLPCSLDELLPPEHPARLVWAAVESLDLSRFHEPIKAREGVAGREPADPMVMVALWLLAATDGVGSGRRLAELCEHHAAYRWVCGGVSMNYHSLNDFRVGHRQALDELFTQVLGRLMHAGLVQVSRITQDSTKVRASAGSNSFRRRTSLEEALAEAKAHVEELSRLADESPAAASERQRANAERVAAEQLSRVKRAMEEVAKVEASKAQQKQKPSKQQPARASTTDPEARVMKMGDGGFRPAYSVQLAQDPVSRAVVGVSVTNGSDKDQAEAMRRQVEQRTGQKVVEHLADGSYATHEAVEAAAGQGVTLYAPVPESKKQGQDRFAPRQGDPAAVAEWRRRMATPEAREVYGLRGRTSETVNADLKTYRALGPLLVRGLAKATCVALWSALAYNLMHFGTHLAGLVNLAAG